MDDRKIHDNIKVLLLTLKKNRKNKNIKTKTNQTILK